MSALENTSEPTPVERNIRRAREAVALRPAGHPDHARAYIALSNTLYDILSGDEYSHLLDEAITVERKVLAFGSTQYRERAVSCMQLALYLTMRYEDTSDEALVDEAIAFQREALDLCPSGHPEHALSCGNLAHCLNLRYERTNEMALLTEATALEREAASLRPAGHPDHTLSCRNLGLYLNEGYKRTGDAGVLDEAIALQQEVLASSPDMHSDRATGCADLAFSLGLLYERTGEASLLDQAIALEREALVLRPSGDEMRAVSCGNLANSLTKRYEQAGDVILLDEVVILEREALSLRPLGHPDRGLSCGSLAAALYLYHKQTGKLAQLEEAITLEREALALSPKEYIGRAMACTSLAASLMSRYNETREMDGLDEAITLLREALDLRPSGHPARPMTCLNLAISLKWRYEQAHEDALLDEALVITRESVMSASPRTAWRSLSILCRLHLQSDTPHFSISTALEHLCRIPRADIDDVRGFIDCIVDDLELLWSFHDAWTPDIPSSMVLVYSSLIDKLPRMAGFALDTSTQLSALKATGSVGSDACVAAVMAGRPGEAIELLDHVHGIIWSQALHLRDPQLGDLPKNLAVKLETLVRAFAVPQVISAAENAGPTHGYLTSQDLRREQNSRLQALLSEVRAMPGLERFMLSSTFNDLRKVASQHPVVILVAARGSRYALIISDPAQAGPHALPLDITQDRLLSLRETANRAGLRDGAGAQDNEASERLGIYKPSAGPKKVSAFAVLSEIWARVVKPVIEHLQLQVSLY
jgi:tetratricopeptide (TPR) repeat protein